VIRARHKETGNIVAIKLIKNIFKCIYQARLAYREIFIMRKFSEIEDNIYTTKLVDVIFPKQFERLQEGGGGEGELPWMKNMMMITYIFLVMDFMQTDFRKLLNSTPKTSLNDEHVITILYNQLCVLNFLHSANVVHRDLKPGNFLIDTTCNVKICDFGLARVMPSFCTTEKDLRKFQKEIFKFKFPEMTFEQRKSRFEDIRTSMSQALQQTQAERSKKKREISSVIMSRWYRSPEVILTYPFYNHTADIWSLGCILGELLYCAQRFSSKPDFDNKVRFLFQGDSCFPISPQKAQPDKNQETVSSGDQIIKICQHLRSLDDKDFSFVSDPVISGYIRNVQTRAQSDLKPPFRQMFPDSDPELIYLLEQMLTFNPYFRPSAKNLLQSKIFDRIRQPELERPAPFKLVITPDKGEFKQDYDKQDEIEWIDYTELEAD
jgi:mitogen-activated protein kinase 1/3